MTIRKTLLFAFGIASLLPSVLLATLAFASASRAMHAEIERSLQVEASTVSLDIDKMLFERLQNAQTWSRLEVMQDIQINDVDKQLAKFLREVKTGYRGVYVEVLSTDAKGKVVASSDPGSIGKTRPLPKISTAGASGYSTIRLGELEPAGPLSRPVLPIIAPVPSLFGTSSLGDLTLLFDWSQIYRILDQAGQGGRDVVLLDSDGHVIAASASLRRQGVLSKALPPDWFAAQTGGTTTRDGSALGLPPLTIGFDHSHGYGYFQGFGWTTLVLQPSREAFAPVHNMGLAFIALLILTSTAAAAFAIVVANRIARPIIGLTQLTRDFAHGRPLVPVTEPADGEVGELAEAFASTIGELEKSRVELVRASKLAALGELSAVVAHEIRTPIGILRSSAQMLARETGLSEEGRELTGFIQSESTRLNGLVSTLLESTRVRPPLLKQTGLNRLLANSIAMLATQAQDKSIVIETALADPTPMVECDSEQMTQVLLNLLQNALQILPLGGRIRVSSSASKTHARAVVADDGPGIPAEQRAQVFEAFFSTREGGFGLGLAAVQQIVVAHGGTIVVEASDWGGAQFTITLPRIEGHP